MPVLRINPSSFIFSRWIFLRLLGIIFFIAFVSFWVQAEGLIGTNGILPASKFLSIISQQVGIERFYLVPTLAWLFPDGYLLMCFLGASLSLLLTCNIGATRVLLLSLYMLYLSLLSISGVFMSFQWDILLLETSFLAILIAPSGLKARWPTNEQPPQRLALLLMWVLLFKFMFLSGIVKLLSGDSAWRSLTALSYHYETQPLPTVFAWYIHQLPLWFQKVSTGAMFAVELVIPFFIFLTRSFRIVAGFSIIGLQLLIAATGNYTFFNFLTIALALLLLDDRFLARFIPERLHTMLISRKNVMQEGIVHRNIVTTVCMVLIGLNMLLLASTFLRNTTLIKPLMKILQPLAPFYIVNHYGLFAIMTTTRNEIVFEGSNDKKNWKVYEFKYKPQNLRGAPKWAAPHQPRLDWQMWFAALSSYDREPWFVNTAIRLLQGSPEVLALFRNNPFPGGAPKYIRAQFYEYHFTNWQERKATGNWWKRGYKGLYLPITSLQGIEKE